MTVIKDAERENDTERLRREVRSLAARNDIDGLAALPRDQLELRRHEAAERLEMRSNRLLEENRNATEREDTLSKADLAEVEALDAALVLNERNATHSERVSNALTEARTRPPGTSPSVFLPSQKNMEILETHWRSMSPVTVIEERATVTTSDQGTARTYAPGQWSGPRSLWRASGIPTTPADGYDATVPRYTLPAGAGGVDEGDPHGEFDGVTPAAFQVKRHGAHSTLTSESLISTSVQELTQAHARIVARDTDVTTVAAIEQTAVVGLSLDEAILLVADEAGRDPADLWMFGRAAALAPFIGGQARTPASGPDTESFAIRYAGARVYVTGAASADEITVFDPFSVKAVATALASQLVHNPTDGSQTFGQWLHYGVARSLVGAALTVDVSGD